VLSLDKQNALREQYRREQPDWQPATEVYAALVHQAIRPTARVLDLGCGRGGLVEQLEHPLRQVVGVDPDLASLRQHRLPALPRAAAWSDALPFVASSFDVVFASWLLEHLAHPSLTLGQISQVLRPGGRFIFITPNAGHPLAWLNRWLGRFARLQGALVQRLYGRSGGDTFPTYYRANRPAALRRLAGQHNLRLAELHTVADPTYLAFTPALFRLMCRLERRIPAERRLHLVGVLQRD
jgi:SAM-dependent methyltransferase